MNSHSISRRAFLRGAAVSVTGVFLHRSAPGAPAEKNDRPNIVLCMADDQGWGETGYYGHPHVKTPVMDEMAAAGLRFDRFYAGAPVCSPTRASVMTGRHPNRSGVLCWNFAIRPEEITIARVLKDAGYATGHFGKWHLGAVKKASPVNPNKCGFDEYLSHDNFFEMNPPLSRNGADPEIHKGESSEVVVDAALEFIRTSSSKGKAFLAVIWFGSPHGPYSGLEKDLALYKKAPAALRARFAEITAMDRAMGKLRAGLGELKITDNTLLWYCSDNGIPGKSGPTGGLRGNKGNLFEGGIRVPAIVEWPAVVTKPRKTSMPCVTSDIFPTVLDLLGVKRPDRTLDGISLRPLIEGKSTERPAPIGFWVYPWKSELKGKAWMDPDSLKGTTPTAKRKSIQFLNFRHPNPRTKDFPGPAAWMDNRYKLVISGAKMLLFDIVNDPRETRDLADDKPDVVSKMKDALLRWQGSVERSLSGADYR